MQACPFLIDVYTEDCDDAEFKVAAIEEMMDKLQRPLCQSVMEKVWTLFHDSNLKYTAYIKDNWLKFCIANLRIVYRIQTLVQFQETKHWNRDWKFVPMSYLKVLLLTGWSQQD